MTGEKIKAIMHISVYCPNCGSVLYRDFDNAVLRCEMMNCPNYKVKFKVPSIDLERADDEPVN